MPKYVVVPQVTTYPVPDGMNQVTGEFDSVESAIAAASAALTVTPGAARSVCEVVSRLSASVSVAVASEKAAK
jgi:hypothetical protein